MVNNVELLPKISKEKLIRYLNDIRTEVNSIEFKTIFSDLAKFKAELIYTTIALMNTEGGGWLIFGVEDKTFKQIGLLEETNWDAIDTTEIHNKVKPYIDNRFDLAIACYEIDANELKKPQWSGKKSFAIMYVAECFEPVMLKRDIQYFDGKGNRLVASAGDIPIRDGAKTCRAGKDDLVRLFSKMQRKHNNGQTPVWESTFTTDDEAKIKFVGREPLGGPLPPREEVTIEFIGRKKELSILWNWFKDSSRKKYLLTGWGGKGKTAIAYEFATQVKKEAPENFVMVIWLSAKERQFEEGEIRKFEARDFWDLPSLMDAIIRKYGFTDYLELSASTDDKRTLALTLLETYPALVVADDIDSLTAENEEAYEFLYSKVDTTNSKVLFTSRRVLSGFGHIKTEVSGLEKPDAEQFINSRIGLYQLEANRFPPNIIKEIINVTESSPLYMEDLLRLCSFFPIEDAIMSWKQRGGDKAREYALQKELDRLTPFAISTVFACSIARNAVSLEEIQYITDRPIDEIRADMTEIQNLFLISRPRLIDGEERYDVNENTRTLIVSTYQNNENFKNLKQRYDRRFGRLGVSEKDNIASYVRKAITLQSIGNQKEAEELLLMALKQYPNNPDLIAQLGVTYTHWNPPRFAEARSQFEKAQRLNCRQEWMYVTWSGIECDADNWLEAIRVAEAGINLGFESIDLYRIAGYAHSRQGQYLRYSFHSDELVEVHLLAADTLLRKGLENPNKLVDFARRKQNSLILRALVINCEALGRIDDMYMFLDKWQEDNPNDPVAYTEWLRLSARHPRDTTRE